MKHIGECGHGRTGSLGSRYGPEETDHRVLGGGGYAEPTASPFLDFTLFGQETVDFRLHDLNAFLLTGCHRLSVFDKSVDQQVLKLHDPRPARREIALLCADPCFSTSRDAAAV